MQSYSPCFDLYFLANRAATFEVPCYSADPSVDRWWRSQSLPLGQLGSRVNFPLKTWCVHYCDCSVFVQPQTTSFEWVSRNPDSHLLADCSFSSNRSRVAAHGKLCHYCRDSTPILCFVATNCPDPFKGKHFFRYMVFSEAVNSYNSTAPPFSRSLGFHLWFKQVASSHR